MVYRRGAGLFQSSGLPVYSGGVSGSSKGSGAGGVAAGFFPAVFLAGGASCSPTGGGVDSSSGGASCSPTGGGVDSSSGGASCSPTGLRFLVLWYRKKCRMALF